ncbi:Potassium channel subfamily K member 18 [Strongyloides ratti]|uniref:Potassium channel subfamily K member 18 n=1 Tax=Strongyloides ratti TaxID=34506 RepID=A0A090KTS2_STRRB|nr:Potassium channel subfamily K member 18 [Strongyloides ratti]CEF60806.1 Potassium channel subfamily K member 18 [Strongyloides ratti]
MKELESQKDNVNNDSCKKIKVHFKKLAPYALHFFIIVAVGIYVIVGAIAIRNIEAIPKDSLNKKEFSMEFLSKQKNGNNKLLLINNDEMYKNRNDIIDDYLKKNLNNVKYDVSMFTSKNNHSTFKDDKNSFYHTKRKPRMLRKRRCVISALKTISKGSNCKENAINIEILKILDECYKEDLLHTIHESPSYEHLSIQTMDSSPIILQKNTTEKDFINNNTNEEKNFFNDINLEDLFFIKDLLSDDENYTYWTLMDAILFCFTVITTIGYGNTAPQTTGGRLFVIFYGLIGVPFTMLAIANFGKFLAEILKQWTKPMYYCIKYCWRCCKKRKILNKSKSKQQLIKKDSINSFKESVVDVNGNTTNILSMENKNNDIENKIKKQTKFAIETEKIEKINNSIVDDDDESEIIQEEDPFEKYGAISLFIAFVLYIVFGSFIIASYEPEMDFFKAIYFNFVTLTTIGLGDLVPKSQRYLAVTLLYCVIGLALTTIAIEIAADYLRKLHYFGRKIDNVGNVAIWFGGQKLTMKQLVKNLGDQFNIPENELNELNMNNFVDSAIKVEAGELETLRKPNIDPNKPIYITDFHEINDGASVIFADDEELLEFPPFPNPSIAQNILPSRSLSPSLAFYEHAILTPTPPPLPPNERGSITSYEGNLFKGFKNDIISKHQNVKYYDKDNNIRKNKDYLPNGKLNGTKQYSDEARRRFEAYRQQWQKFRVTQWEENDTKSKGSLQNISTVSLFKEKPSLVTKESSLSLRSSKDYSSTSISSITSKSFKIDFPPSTIAHDNNV